MAQVGFWQVKDINIDFIKLLKKTSFEKNNN